ncbi:MAG: acyltransferase family protein [Prevotella sp.]|nr:acyltransferase family protein [Prevotella sp.]
MAASRMRYLDSVKFITIFLVVMGHFLVIVPCGILGERTSEIIYSFHMPLFMIISGFFSMSSYRRPFTVFFRKKAVALLLPVVSWTLIITLYSLLVGHSTERIITELKGNSWFLKTLFGCYFVVYLLKRIGCRDVVVCLSSVVVFCLIPKGSTFQFNWMYIFFWIGYYLRKYETFLASHSLKILALSSTIYMVGLYFMYKLNVTQVILMSHAAIWREYPAFLVRLMVGIGGSLAMIEFVKLIYRKCYDETETWLAQWGRYTLGIYVMQTFLVQYLFQDYCRFTYGSYMNYLTVLAFSLITCLFSMFFIRLFTKSRLLDVVLFGGQYWNKK